MRQYPLDGLQYGAERVGSLSEVLFRGLKASCFCEHCQKRNAQIGVDLKRVAQGFRDLDRILTDIPVERNAGAEGVLTRILGVFFNYPELLTFYREWLRADAEIQKSVYEAAKKIRPEADVGQHIDHQRSSWDIFYRAAIPYSMMAEYNDYIKPILYHEILGPRLKEWVIDEMQPRVLNDFSHELALELFYKLFGHDAGKQPAYLDLEDRAISPEYVYRETRRCVDGAAGKAKVYAGIGVDVPHYVPNGMKPVISNPRSVREATRLAIQAGADGVVASREYREMTVPSMRAFGQAVRTSQA